jgi:hypothetical protein
MAKSLLLASGLLFASAPAAFADVSVCDVDRVYSGSGGVVIARVTGCTGDNTGGLELTLRYAPSTTTFYSDFYDLTKLQTVVTDAADVTNMKQTFELAKVNNRKVKIQFGDRGGIDWVSMD